MPTADTGRTLALTISACAVLIATFAAPIITPVLAAIGVAASVIDARRHRGPWRWLPAGLFVLAMAMSLIIDLALLASSTSVEQPTPAAAAVQ
jgi:MFS family permease